MSIGPIECPRWALMWGIAVAMFVACKLVTLRRGSWPGVSGSKKAAYLFLWPGMDAASFLSGRSSSPPAAGEWLAAALKTGIGLALLLLAPRVEPGLARGWVAMIGLILILHFGSFHLLSCFWRTLGVTAPPIMRAPMLATSVSEFWGRRWNVAFRDLTFRLIFRPLGKRWGVVRGTLAGFLLSGGIHELVITVPAGGGYGGPTVFFLLQGIALLVGRACPSVLGSGWRGWLFTQGLLLLTVPLLFPPVFVTRVVVPFLAWLHGS